MSSHYDCVKCGSPTRMMVLAGISAPGDLSHKFSKQNLRRKDVWLTHVNWETADYLCTNQKCGHVTDGYGNYVTKLAAENKRLRELFDRWESSGDVVATSYAMQAKLVLGGGE